ncbi:hypothetical protein J7K43_06910 [Candidatus Calescamantes bacterium]|nr:hypothetical protein [Candidatus Calescamantes bacterium]
MKNRKLLGKNVLNEPYPPTINILKDNSYLSINKWRYVFYINLHKSDRQKSCFSTGTNIWHQGITQIYKEKHFKEAFRVISLSTKSVIFMLILNKVIDIREINTFKDDLYGVIGFYGFGAERGNLYLGLMSIRSIQKPYVWFIEQP